MTAVVVRSELCSCISLILAESAFGAQRIILCVLQGFLCLTFPRCCFLACFAQPLTAEKMPVTPWTSLWALGPGLCSAGKQQSESGSCAPTVKQVSASVAGARSVLHVLSSGAGPTPGQPAKGKPP